MGQPTPAEQPRECDRCGGMIAGPDPIRELRCVCGRRRIDVEIDDEMDAYAVFQASQAAMTSRAAGR